MDAKLVKGAFRRAGRLGLAALDALHLEAAIAAGAQEFITTERDTKPLFREKQISVRKIGRAAPGIRPNRSSRSAATYAVTHGGIAEIDGDLHSTGAEHRGGRSGRLRRGGFGAGRSVASPDSHGQQRPCCNRAQSRRKRYCVGRHEGAELPCAMSLCGRTGA